MKQIKIIPENYDEIKIIALQCRSITDLCGQLGWMYNRHRVSKIKQFLIESNFDETIFKINSKNNRRCVYNNKERLQEVIKNANSISDVLRAYNKRLGSGNFESVKKYIKHFNIDCSHFDSNKRFLTPNYKGRIHTNDLFVENSNALTRVVRERIIKEKLLEYKCANEMCGNTGEWFGQKIALQLDHVNGNRRDNRLINLRFLCPNCHCATPTWGNKRGHKNEGSIIKSSKLSLLFEKEKEHFLEKEIIKFKNLKEILVYFNVKDNSLNYKEIKRVLEIYKDNANVKKFYKNIKKKLNEYSADELVEKLKNSNFMKVAKELNCSDNGLRSYLIRNGIDIKNIKEKQSKP